MAAPFELTDEESALAGVSYRDGVLRLASDGQLHASFALTAAVAGFVGTVGVGLLAGFGVFGTRPSGDPAPLAWLAEVAVLAAAGLWWWRAVRCAVLADAAAIVVQSSVRRPVRVSRGELAAVRLAQRGGWELPELVRVDGSVVPCRPLAARAGTSAAAHTALLARFTRLGTG